MDLLIVEDDPIIRDGMSEYLSEWGYHVIEARMVVGFILI